jgi:protein KRI1
MKFLIILTNCIDNNNNNYNNNYNNGGNNDYTDTSESESEEEDERGELISREVEGQFIKTLMAIQTKDNKVYDPEAKFFEGIFFT